MVRLCCHQPNHPVKMQKVAHGSRRRGLRSSSFYTLCSVCSTQRWWPSASTQTNRWQCSYKHFSAALLSAFLLSTSHSEYIRNFWCACRLADKPSRCICYEVLRRNPRNGLDLQCAGRLPKLGELGFIAVSRTPPWLASGWGRRVGVFPEREEVSVCGFRLGGVTGLAVGSSELEMR